MRILVIDEDFPYPLDSGKRIRSFNLLSRLAANHELHFLAYGQSGTESFEAAAAARMNPIAVPAELSPQSGAMFYLRLLANLFSPDPYIVARHYSSVFQKAFDETVARLRPDVITCEWSPYATFMKDVRGIPRVAVAQNVEYRIWQRYYEHETSLHRKWYIGRQAPKVAAFEQRIFNMVEGAVAVSDEEAVELKALNPNLRVRVVENGVDLKFFKPAPDEPERESLVFVGAMHWRPNQDAVCWFVQEIFPILRARRPDISIVVVGQSPPPHIQKLDLLPGVHIAGRVEDVRPYVDSAAVYVVPLRIGGGTRLKILEALAMKKAVVSTSVGAEGLAVADGMHLMIADGAEPFADRIDLLLRDSALRRELGERGRKLVEEQYGWDRLAGKLETFLNEMVGKS
jgi:polysaccharide biosynthesis protein PslH